jgi:hypothetical protein
MIIEIRNLLESKWEHTPDGDVIGKKKLVEMRVLFIVGFYTGSRGEELSLIKLARTWNRLSLLDRPENVLKLPSVGALRAANCLD